MAGNNNETGSKATEQPLKGKLKGADLPEEGTVANLAKFDAEGKPTGGYMWIKGTGNSKHLAKDSVHEVNVISGKKLISKGAAVETTAPKPKAASKKSANNKDEDDE